MPGPGVLLICAAAAGLYLGGSAVVRGVKKVEHKIVRVFHKPAPKK